MTRYAKYMQHIHNAGEAITIERAVTFLLEDVVDYLVDTGVKRDSNLITHIRSLKEYEYRAAFKKD